MGEHIFISYSRDDASYVRELAAHIRQAGLSVWVDEQLATGERFEHVIAERIDTCGAFVVIMSPAAGRSPWVANELRRAQVMHKPVLPLLLAGRPFLMLGHTQHEDVTGGLMPAPKFFTRLGRIVGESATPPPSIVDDEPFTRTAHRLPRRDFERLIGRDAELEAVVDKLSRANRTWVVVIDGIGGVGKTAFALEIAHRLVRPADGSEGDYFDAIVWVSAKRNSLSASGIIDRQSEFEVLRDLQREIGVVLGRTDLGQLPEDQRRTVVRELLSGPARVLLVLDNLEEVDDRQILAFLQDLPQPAKALATTRHRIDVAYSLRLEGLRDDEAEELIRREAAADRRNISLTAAEVTEIQRKTGGLPLAIEWSLALVSIGHSVPSVLRRLGSGHADIMAFCFDASVRALGDGPALRTLATASMFQEPVGRDLLGAAAGFADDVVGRDDAIQLLIQLSLLNQSDLGFSLLPLTRTFVSQLLADRPPLQGTVQRTWLGALRRIAAEFQAVDVSWRNISGLSSVGPHVEWGFQWARGQGDLDQALGLARAVCAYLDVVGRWDDLLTTCADVGGLARSDADLQADMAWYQNWIHGQRGEFDAAWAALESVRDLVTEPAQRLQFLLGAAQTSRRQQHFADAESYLAQAAEVLPGLTDEAEIVRANFTFERGKLARDQGDWAAAETLFLQTRAVFDADAAADEIAAGRAPVYDIERALGVLGNLGLVEHRLGNPSRAAGLLSRALAYTRQHGSVPNLLTLLVRYADVLADLRRDAEAAAALAEAQPWAERLRMYDELQACERIRAKIARR